MFGWLRKLMSGSQSETKKSQASSYVDYRSPEDLLEDFRSNLSRELAGGYSTPEEALQYATDIMVDDFEPGILDKVGPKILAQELQAHIDRQANWPEVTDCDRLDTAFASLEENGIISRQNFTCCGSCGATEIWDEIHKVKEAGVIARGYAFFHQQDTESAADGDGLYLNYGSIEEGEDAAVEIGREIQRELEAHGLSTDWNGKLSTRINVALDWKRRIPVPHRDKLN